MTATWPADWAAMVAGRGCSMCAKGRPDDDGFGVRIQAAKYSDAYLQRADMQRGYTLVIWRGRHVAEPTELEAPEAAGYWLEVLRVAEALQRYYHPLKMNYEVLGNALPHLHTHLVPRYLDDPALNCRFVKPEEGSGPSASERGHHQALTETTPPARWRVSTAASGDFRWQLTDGGADEPSVGNRRLGLGSGRQIRPPSEAPRRRHGRSLSNSPKLVGGLFDRKRPNLPSSSSMRSNGSTRGSTSLLSGGY
jgi:diadenosine tetraphosphate (Ap4A) HIT family hydrolase